MISLQEQHITQSEIVKLIYVPYKGVIQETTYCEGEYVSSVFICPKTDGVLITQCPSIRNIKSFLSSDDEENNLS